MLLATLQVTTIHTKHPRNLRSNATPGCKTTIHADYLHNFRLNATSGGTSGVIVKYHHNLRMDVTSWVESTLHEVLVAPFSVKKFCIPNLGITYLIHKTTSQHQVTACKDISNLHQARNEL